MLQRQGALAADVAERRGEQRRARGEARAGESRREQAREGESRREKAREGESARAGESRREKARGGESARAGESRREKARGGASARAGERRREQARAGESSLEIPPGRIGHRAHWRRVPLGETRQRQLARRRRESPRGAARKGASESRQARASERKREQPRDPARPHWPPSALAACSARGDTPATTCSAQARIAERSKREQRGEEQARAGKGGASETTRDDARRRERRRGGKRRKEEARGGESVSVSRLLTSSGVSLFVAASMWPLHDTATKSSTRRLPVGLRFLGGALKLSS